MSVGPFGVQSSISVLPLRSLSSLPSSIPVCFLVPFAVLWRKPLRYSSRCFATPGSETVKQWDLYHDCPPPRTLSLEIEYSKGENYNIISFRILIPDHRVRGSTRIEWDRVSGSTPELETLTHVCSRTPTKSVASTAHSTDPGDEEQRTHQVPRNTSSGMVGCQSAALTRRRGLESIQCNHSFKIQNLW